MVKKKTRQAGKKTCPSCGAVLGARTKICPKCQHQFVSSVRTRGQSTGWETQLKRLKDVMNARKLSIQAEIARLEDETKTIDARLDRLD